MLKDLASKFHKNVTIVSIVEKISCRTPPTGSFKNGYICVIEKHFILYTKKINAILHKSSYRSHYRYQTDLLYDKSTLNLRICVLYKNVQGFKKTFNTCSTYNNTGTIYDRSMYLCFNDSLLKT